MNRTLSHLDALLANRNLSGGDRLASLNRSIESIERKLGGIGNPSGDFRPQPEMASGRSKIEELERRVRELSGGPSFPATSQQPHMIHQPARSSMFERTAQPGNPLAEIAERKRALNTTTHIPPPQSFVGRDQLQNTASQIEPHSPNTGIKILMANR